MDEKERVEVQEMVSACARLALYLADELEPSSNAVLEEDLDAVYGMLVAVERRAREAGLLKDE